MRRNISAYVRQQVFLNFPYEDAYEEFANALAFAVFAGGLLPLTAQDLSTPDALRLHNIVAAISNCRYSVHDLSRAHGIGAENLAQLNMPLEMGMALYRTLSSSHSEHQGAFFVPTLGLYQRYASDLAGLDPICYGDDLINLLTGVYEWLSGIVPSAYFSHQPASQVILAFEDYSKMRGFVVASGPRGRISYLESRELMQRICGDRGWWDWRETKAGRVEFPILPLQWSADPGSIMRSGDGGL